MKATIEAGALHDAVRWAARALPARPPLPILAGVQLSVSAGILSASAFDYTTQAGAVAAADGELDDLLVPGKLLADIAGRLTGTVTLERDGDTDQRLTVRSGRDRFRLPVMASDDYPAVPGPPDPDGVAAGLADILQRITPTACRDAALPILMCAQITAADGQLTLMATDRYRAAIERIAWDGPDAGPVLVPATRLHDLVKNLGADKPGLGFGQHSLSITGGHQSAAIGYTAGDFPLIQRLMAGADTPDPADVDRDALVSAVQAAGLFTEQSQPIRLAFTEGSVTVSAMSDTAGDGEIPLEATYSGGDRDLFVNPFFFIDALNAAPGPVVRLHLPETVGRIRVDALPEHGGEPAAGRDYIVMSIRAGSRI